MQDDSGLAIVSHTVEYWFKRYSDRARKAMALANRFAQKAACDRITPEHVLGGVLVQDDAVAVHVLADIGINAADVLSQLKLSGDGPEEDDKLRLPASKATHLVVNESIRVCLANRHDGVGTEHLLIALVRSESPVMQGIVKQFQLNETKLTESMIRLLDGRRDLPQSALGRLWLRISGRRR